MVAFMDKKIIAFDLDDTLAPSKSPLPAEVAQALRALLARTAVCVISGGQWGQFESQLLENLGADAEVLTNLHLMPTCGTRYYRFAEETWQPVYINDLPEGVRSNALEIIESTARELGLWESATWGPILEDRGSQITFSALGQAAPVEAKKAWDPTGEKKTSLRDALIPLLPELEVRSGGSTSVDVTAKGIDKAYGIKRVLEANGWSAEDLLFIGDRLDPAGNDYPVKAAGYETQAVSGWEETVEVINSLLAN